MEFLAAVIAIVAMIFASRALQRVRDLQTQLTALDQRLSGAAPPVAAAPILPETPAAPSAAEPAQSTPAPERNGRGRDRCSLSADVPPRRRPPPPRTRRALKELRGALRRELGGVDRRACARARRHLHGAVFDRGRPDRPRRAHLPRRPACGRADRGRRMDTAARLRVPARQRPDRAHPEHPHRRRHDRRLRDDLCGLCALRIPARRRSPSSCSASSRSRRSPPRCCTGRRSPRSDRSARSSRRCWSRPTCRTTGRSTFISPSSPPPRSSLARARMWRWLAITAVAFGTLWVFPGIVDTRVDALTPHALYAVVGFALAARC